MACRKKFLKSSEIFHVIILVCNIPEFGNAIITKDSLDNDSAWSYNHGRWGPQAQEAENNIKEANIKEQDDEPMSVQSGEEIHQAYEVE